MWFRKKQTLVVHDGRFHADDVFACAVLALVLGDTAIRIIRTRTEDVITKAAYVVDVGGIYDPTKNRFDHHQKEGAGMHASGIPYASFGLVWKHYGMHLAESAPVFDRIEKQLVESIDAGDNGVETYTPKENMPLPYGIHRFFGALMPTWDDTSSPDEAFFEALAVAKRILTREIAHAKAHVRAMEKIQKAYEQGEDSTILVLDGSYPWGEFVAEKPEIVFVVSKQDEDRWKASAVPVSVGSFKNRVDFPESWAGLRNEELEQASGVTGALFCHRGRFLCVASRKEAALQLVAIARRV